MAAAPAAADPKTISNDLTQEVADRSPTAGEQYPSDPLLDSGSFIFADADSGRNSNQNGDRDGGGPSLNAHTGSKSANPTDPIVTSDDGSPSLPQQQPRQKRSQEEAASLLAKLTAERPDWLPDDWTMDFKIRNSGASSGVIDRYYFDPAGRRFRSKVQVLDFLKTGSVKRKPKAEAENPADSSGDQKKKKSGPGMEDGMEDSGTFIFDHDNPPESVCWAWSPSKEKFVPSIDGVTLPESTQQEWAIVFDNVIQGKKPLSP